MRVRNSNRIELIVHYAAFVFKSATLVIFLPLADFFATDDELKFTALLLNIMYLIIAVEFGFSIQISKVIGDNTSTDGTRHNVKNIAKIASKIFIILALISLLIAIIFYVFNLHHFESVENSIEIYAFAIIVFTFQLYFTKSYALSMGTTFLKTVKIIEACIFCCALTALILNLVVFKNWLLHLHIFLLSSILRSLLLSLLEVKIVKNSPSTNNEKISLKEFLGRSSEIGFSSVSTQFLVNILLSKVYHFWDTNISNDINIVARIIQGIIVAIRQITDLRFFQTSRDLPESCNKRMSIVRDNVQFGLFAIFMSSIVAVCGFHVFKFMNDANYQLLLSELILWCFLLAALFGCGLIAQQLLLINIIIHRYIFVINIFAIISIFYFKFSISVFVISLLYPLLLILLYVTSYRFTLEQKV